MKIPDDMTSEALREAYGAASLASDKYRSYLHGDGPFLSLGTTRTSPSFRLVRPEGALVPAGVHLWPHGLLVAYRKG